MVGASVDKTDLAKLAKQLDRLSLKKQEKELRRILASASLPIRKRSKSKAKRVISANSGHTFTRKGTKYKIEPRTIEKSIGVINLKKARVPAIDVGYRTKGTYNGWFAHFVDAGTENRSTLRGYATGTGADRGRIKPHNIMQAGISKIPQAEQKIKKDVVRVIKRLSK